MVDVKLPSLDTRISWFEDWEENTREARQLSRRDRDYYDNHQWTEDEINKLKERGQPVITNNRIARKVNFIVGEEIEKRVDPTAIPRKNSNQSNVDSASAATDGLRFVEEKEEFDAVRSSVFRNCIVEGYGGSIKEIEEEDGEIKHVLRSIEWDRLCYDHHSRSPDFSDARWLGLVVWMDLDEAIEMHPDAEMALRAAVDGASMDSTDDLTDDTPLKHWADKKRQRVKFVQMYHLVGRDWYVSLFTKGSDIEPCEPTGFLNEKKTHHVCPLLMTSGYVDKDGFRYGVVRQLISPQDMVNKRESKTMHLMSVNSIMVEDNVLADPDKFMDELAKPDGVATGIRPGALASGALEVRNNLDVSMAQVQLLQGSKADIDQIGPSAATMPDLPDSASGIAFARRTKAANKELGQLFDNLRSWALRQFKLDWLCIRAWQTDEWWTRVADDPESNGFRFSVLNQRMTRAQRMQEILAKPQPPEPEKALELAAGEFAPQIQADVMARVQQMSAQLQQAMQALQQGQIDPRIGPQIEEQAAKMQDPQYLVELALSHPLMQEEITVNQVEQMLVDIIIEETPDTSSLAEQEFSALSALAPSLLQAAPEKAMPIARMLVKASHFPNKKECLKMLDEKQEPSEEQQAEAQAMKQMQMQGAQAQVAVNATKAELQQAQTAKTAAEAQAIPIKTESEVANTHAQAIGTAIEAGKQSVGGIEDGEEESLQA